MAEDTQTFETSHLDIDVDIPRGVDEMSLPDIYVGDDPAGVSRRD